MKAFIAFLLVLIVAGLGYLIWSKEAEKRPSAPSQAHVPAPLSTEEELFGTYLYTLEGSDISAAVVLNRDHTGSMVSRVDGKVTLAQNGRWDADLAYVRLTDGSNPIRFKRVGNNLELIGIEGQRESDVMLFKKVPDMLVAR